MKPEEKERIEKQAEEFASDKIAEASVIEGYIAGATAQRERAEQLRQLIAQIKDVCTDYEVPGIESIKILQIINDYENGK